MKKLLLVLLFLCFCSIELTAQALIRQVPPYFGGRLRLVDRNYTPFSDGTSYFTIGSENGVTIPAANHFTAQEIYFPFTASGTSKNYSAFRSFLYPSGSPVSPTVFGNFSYIFTNAFTPSGTSSVYGYYSTVDIGFPVTSAYGGSFTAAHGSSAASGAGTITAIAATAGMGHNGTLTTAYAGDFFLSSSGNTAPQTTTNGYIFRARANVQSNVDVTTLKGLAFESWTKVGTVGTSYGIYADTSIDVGTTKYFIYSTSASPSVFSGTVSLAKGGNVASAGTISISGNVFHVTGTTTITSVSGTGVTQGTCITIIFDGILTFTDGSNLKLAGNFVTSADDTISLCYDGTNWYETARAVN